MIIEQAIETERLILKCLDETHANKTYLGWVTDPDVTRYMEMRHTTFTQDALREHIEAMNRSADSLQLGIFTKDSGCHIGNIKLGPILKHHRNADLGLLLGDKSVWGQGYGSEAIDAMSNYAHKFLNLHRITAGCYEGNTGSVKAFTKCGYLEDGRLKQYFFCEGEWQDCIVLYRIF